ncbi:MAG: U32 family peptidase [Mycoplasmoidaceae bacterium]|nr:U32 family peptidase [Mycoplasmoidaceae bacterium]
MQDQLSTRLSCCLGIKDIKKIVCDKLVVSLNNIFVDDRLALLEAILKQLKSIGVKTIIFTDFAVKQICNEINYHPYFVYNSETLTTNYSQLPFLLEKGINEVVLPRELFWNEIKEFANNKGKMSIQIQAEGYGLMMHSK